MKRHLIILLGMLLSALTMTAQKSRTVYVGDFSALRVMDGQRVDYHMDIEKAGTIEFTATDNIANMLIFTNNGKGKLTLQLTSAAIDRPDLDLPTLTVYSSSLAFLENSGDSLVTISGLGHMPKLKLVTSDNGTIEVRDLDVGVLSLKIATGNGNIHAAGRCDKLLARMLGKGHIDAEQLLAGEISCHVTGTGKLSCHIADGGEINLKGCGTGKVYYRGNPGNVKTRGLGSIKAIALDQQ